MALGRLAQEDPTFKVHTDPTADRPSSAAMGELHLEIIVDRMMREYKVEANVGKPQVAYRGDHSPAFRGGRQVYSPDWRTRSVRAREDPTGSTTTGRGL